MNNKGGEGHWRNILARENIFCTHSNLSTDCACIGGLETEAIITNNVMFYCVFADFKECMHMVHRKFALCVRYMRRLSFFAMFKFTIISKSLQQGAFNFNEN